MKAEITIELTKTTIQLEEKTRDRLKEFGKKGESYEDVINKLMDFYEQNVSKK